MTHAHLERHRSHVGGWLRAAVLGANDGVVSTASLVLGVAAAQTSIAGTITAGLAGLVGGALSMAAGEYVSVSSQSDTEQADITREKLELAANPAHEKAELTSIYVGRGLDKELAEQVAEQLMAKDALTAHVRDELGISETIQANPIQAALTSAGTFAVGALLPMIIVFFAPARQMEMMVAGGSLFFLALLGALAAYTGGASVVKGAVRVTFWGLLAMALTAAVGAMFGTVV